MDADATNRALRNLLLERREFLDWLSAKAGISRWGLAKEKFAETLLRSGEKHFAGRTPSSPQMVEEYFQALHLEDLALACACAEGREAAWEYFIANYRDGMRRAAAAIAGKSASAAESDERADSLFGELYGLDRQGRGRQSLFRYFHGRSKLSTWLRTILAQRHVDAIRAGKRLESLDEPEPDGRVKTDARVVPTPEYDPDRGRLVTLLRQALSEALHRLEARDAKRLYCYYAEQRSLAETGKMLGEHESSVSRNLERIRTRLRKDVEAMLRRGTANVNGTGPEAGLSDAQIALCIEYALEDVPVELQGAIGSAKNRSHRKDAP